MLNEPYFFLDDLNKPMANTVLEKQIKRKLHTIGCSLHQNELLFRAVFKHIDGRSLRSFIGTLGRLCANDYHNLTQVKFVPIVNPLYS